MVKTQAVRCFQVLAVAFAVSALVTQAVERIGHSCAMLAQIASPAAPSRSSAIELPDVAIETADGTHTSFGATSGRVRIATMFYSHCPGVCPLTIDALRAIDRQLTAQQRARLIFVLLSLDPPRDSPQALRSLAVERGLTSSRWLLGRTSASDARAFAAAAHIQYRTLSDGSVDHSTGFVLVDGQGRLLDRVSDAGDTTEFVAAVRRALDQQ